MHLMDMCAAMSAYKHSRTAVVTASVDRLDFLAPSKMGDIMKLQSSVNYTGISSMEVGVRIESENPKTGISHHTASAYLTIVSLNENGRPYPPDYVPFTPSEIDENVDRSVTTYDIDDFEGTFGWTAGNDSGSDTFEKTSTDEHGGSYSMGNGTYPDQHIRAWAYKNSVANLSSYSSGDEIRLRFWENFNTES